MQKQTIHLHIHMYICNIYKTNIKNHKIIRNKEESPKKHFSGEYNC